MKQLLLILILQFNIICAVFAQIDPALQGKIHPDWNKAVLSSKLGSFGSNGSQYTNTSSAMEFWEFYARDANLGYYMPIVSNFMSKHAGEENWDAWKSSFDILADPNGTHSKNMGGIIKAGKASVLMLSLPLVIGYKFTGDQRYEIEPEEAEIVSRRFDKVLNGDYDVYYRWLVDKLFEFNYGDKDVVLRINHEMTNPQYAYCCMNAGGYDNESKHKLVWRHAVDVMRARADNQHGGWPSYWLFDFNPQSKHNLHSQDWDTWVKSFYPGDTTDAQGRPYVHVVSYDVYDRFGKQKLYDFYERYHSFVKARDVKAGVCEWGLWPTETAGGESGGDNPEFLDWFLDGLLDLPPSKVNHIVMQAAQTKVDWFNPDYQAMKERLLEIFRYAGN
jgi:hypothetical protein